MKIHTNQFKENISLIGKQLDSKITYELDGVVQTLASEQLNSITPTFQGAILKSVMKELDLDSNIDIPLGTTINYKFGVLVGNAYEYLDFGNYIVYSSEKQEDYDSYKIVCYDKMLYSMKTNENLGITYPISIRNYIKALCTKIGLEFKNQNETFANYDKMINEELYVGQDYTYRDILDELAQVTASTICLDKNDKVEIRYISNTAVDTIDEKFLKDINVNFGQKYGPVNSIVLSRSAESDNIYLQDEQSVANNGLCEIKIKDNQIMNFNNRSEFLPDILKKLDGLEYYLNDFASTGIAYLELCDRYNIKVFDNTYSCVMFNDELLVTQGLGENVHTDMPEETETDYRKADKEDRKINSAFLIVDKQLGEIRGEVTKVESKVEDITTTTQTSTGGNSLYLKEALESNALEYSVDGRCEQATSVQGKNLFDIIGQFKKLYGTSVTVNSTVFTLLENGKINIKGTPTKRTQLAITTGSATSKDIIVPLDSTKTYTFSTNFNQKSISLYYLDTTDTIKPIYMNGATTKSISNAKGIVYINIDIQTLIAYDADYYFQIEQGTATTYEPFVPNSPSPDYPSEIKTVRGIRNLLNSKVASQIIEGITFTHNDDGTVRASGTTGSNPANYNLYNNNFDLKSGTYTLSGCPNGGSSSKYYIGQNIAPAYGNEFGNGLTFTINSDVSDKSIWLSIRPNQTVDILFKPMLEPGSVAHSYVPYGTYEKIKVTGKNIFNIQKWLNATFPVVHGVLNSKTSNSISLTSTADDCYTQTFSMSTITNKTTIDNFGFEIEENTDYTFYTKKSDTIGGTNFVFYFDKDYKYISLKSNNSITNENFLNFTTPPNAKYICFRLGINKSGNTVEFSNIMLLKGTITTTPDYEPYKEKEVLIDLSKENLLETPYTESNKLTATATKNDYYAVIDYYAELEAGKTYTFSCKTDGTFGASNQQTQCYLLFDKKYDYIIHMDDKNCFKFKPTQTGKYYVRYDFNVKGETHSFWDFAIYKGTNADDSYELNSIGDTKDKLEIINGVAVIQKRIGKIVLNGSESWEIASQPTFNAFLNRNLIKDNSLTNLNGLCDFYDVFANEKWSVMPNNSIIIGRDTRHQILIRNDNITTLADFKLWLKANPVTVYYILNEPETITLPNTDIPLYEGVNHVTLVEDLETTTSIKYLRKTPISGEYALNQDLNKTNSNLADTNNQLNQAQSDIDNTKTNLNNNYYNKEQVDSINSTTTQNITQIRNTMEQNITSTEASISKIQETIENGVSKVTTTTGTFDENGLNISKSGQQMSSTLDWDGLEVVRDKGKATETEVLTVRSAGVEAENMTVRNFFIKKPIRIEKCKSITDSTKVGLGFFWIGE